LWAVAIAALLQVRGGFRVERPPSTLRADIAEGLRFLWRNRLLRVFSVMVGVFNFATAATFSILVLYAVGPGSAMGMSAPAFGFLLTTVAAGSLLGSFAAERLERRIGRAKTLGLSFAINAALVGIPAVTANPYVIGAVFFGGGAALIVSNVVMVSLRQRITPARLLGRVNAGHRLVAYGTKPLGAVAGGLLAQFLGLRAVFALMAMLVLALLAGMRVVTESAITAAQESAQRSR
jgi:Na+/melibiose symporter-like transporter